MTLQNNSTVDSILTHEFVQEKPVRLLIKKNLDIYLDYQGRQEIKMQPLIKTVYIFFLRHPEGISFYDLMRYKNELCLIYKTISNRTNEKIIQTYINRLVNRQDNSMNEKISRIKEIFMQLLPESYAKEFMIVGERRHPKRINLDSKSVIWEI